MEMLAEFGLFAAKIIFLLVGLIFLISFILKGSQQPPEQGHLTVKRLNDGWTAAQNYVQGLFSSKAEKKARAAELKQAAKQRAKGEGEKKKRIFVLEFDGSLRAAEVESLRKEIDAIVLAGSPGDEVVIRLKSPGGVVHGYGLAASQLERLRDAEFRLVAAVDEVAASGGYMMAAVAHEILAAPFAIVGSIGVVAGVPNIHRLLKDKKVDYDLLTAGKYKRTLSTLGENTEEGREKFLEDLEATHVLFQNHLQRFRPDLDLDQVATGEYWYGQEATALGLIDGIMTSDSYLISRKDEADIYLVKWVTKKSLGKKLGLGAEKALGGAFDRLLQRGSEKHFL